jgi:NADH dehydrogenase
VLDANGEPLPGLAPVAKQEGAYVAEVIKARLAGKTHAPHFRYRERGKLATIGRRAAIIAFAGLRLKGWLAWWIWGIAHIYFLISLRNRLIVATQVVHGWDGDSLCLYGMPLSMTMSIEGKTCSNKLN